MWCGIAHSQGGGVGYCDGCEQATGIGRLSESAVGCRLQGPCDVFRGSSVDVNGANRQRKGSDLLIGNHQANLTNFGGRQEGNVRQAATAQGWNELREHETDPRPFASGWLEACLIVDAVNALIGPQIQFVPLAVTTNLQDQCARIGGLDRN